MAGRDRPRQKIQGQTSGELRVALFLAASVMLFFWPVWLIGYTFPPGGGDLWGQLYPVWANVARYLRRKVLPMWLPQLMAGDPIIGDLQYGLLNPLNWWLFALPTLPQWAVLLRGMLPLWLAGYGVYRYLRRSPFWRLSTPASLTGAIAYMFSDTFIIHLGHPHIIDVIAWLPWALLAVDRTLKRRRWSLRSSLPIALMVVAGHYQMIGYNVVVVTFYALWQVARRPSRMWLRDVRRLSMIALCALALTLPALLPSLERYPFTERSVLEVRPWRGYQWTPAQAVDWIAPDFHGRSVRTFWGGWARVESGYTGVVALTLAIIGVAANAHRPRGRFVLLLGTFGVLLALGYAGPLFPQLARIELIARMSKTARAIYLFSLAVAMAASLGVQALWDARRIWLWVILIVLVAVCWLWIQTPHWAGTAPTPETQRRALESLRLAAVMANMTALLGWMSKRWRAGRAGLILLLLSELVTTGALAEVEPASSSSASSIFAYLQEDDGWFRVDVDAKARGLMSPAVLQGQGFEVPTTNGNPMEMAAYTQFYWAVPHKGAPMYQLFGAKYIIVPKGALPGGEGIWPVFDSDPHVDVHLNTNAMNRVWLVYRTHPVISFEEAFAFVREDTFDPRKIAVVENGPRLDAEEGKGWLEVLAYGPNRVRFGVHTSVTAILVLSDFLYPGWRGYIDGKPTLIYRTDGIFRGVVIPPGEHIVEMRFRPLSFIVGLWAAAMAAVLCFAEQLRGLTSVSGTL